MRYSPEGQKILDMGSSLALSIMTATKELERIVADQHERDGGVVISDVPVADVPPFPHPAPDDDATMTQDDMATTPAGETDDDGATMPQDDGYMIRLTTGLRAGLHVSLH